MYIAPGSGRQPPGDNILMSFTVSQKYPIMMLD